MTSRQFRTSAILAGAALLLIVTITLSAVGATAALDAWIMRGGGSVNTMVPGFTYAAAAVMKVSLLGTLILLLGAIFAAIHDRTASSSIPFFGVLSVLIQPLTILAGAVLILIFQKQFVDATDILAGSSGASRVAVFAMMLMLGLGAGAGIYALVRHERPKLVPIVGIVSAFALLVLFRYFEFYKLGFDQDRWAG